MTNLTNFQIAGAYGDLLTTTNEGNGLSNVPQQLQDGFGNASTITIATNAVNFNRQGGNTFELDNVPVVSTAADINLVCTSDPFLPGTGAVRIPTGTTAQRPVGAVDGDFRLNTTLAAVEIYYSGAWHTI